MKKYAIALLIVFLFNVGIVFANTVPDRLNITVTNIYEPINKVEIIIREKNQIEIDKGKIESIQEIEDYKIKNNNLMISIDLKKANSSDEVLNDLYLYHFEPSEEKYEVVLNIYDEKNNYKEIYIKDDIYEIPKEEKDERIYDINIKIDSATGEISKSFYTKSDGERNFMLLIWALLSLLLIAVISKLIIASKNNK